MAELRVGCEERKMRESRATDRKWKLFLWVEVLSKQRGAKKVVGWLKPDRRGLKMGEGRGRGGGGGNKRKK